MAVATTSALAALVLLAASGTSGAAGAVPPADASQKLADLGTAIDAAKNSKKVTGGHYETLVQDAIDAKHEFMQVAFAGQKVFGNCDVNTIQMAIDDLDIAADAATYEEGQRQHTDFGRLVHEAKALKRMVTGCSGATKRQKATTDKIVSAALAARRTRKLTTSVHFKDLKDNLMKGTTVYGCDYQHMSASLDEIDDNLYLAAFVVVPDATEVHVESHRRLSLVAAGAYLEDLDKQWAQVPCETTQPPSPQCSDGLDNDGDGKGDGADGGCLSATDSTEATDPWVFDMTSGTTNYIDFKPFFAQVLANAAKALRVFFGDPTTVEDSSSLTISPQQINGTPPCPGETIYVSSGVGSNAPTTSPHFNNPLPPPPDDNHMRIVMDVTGGACTGTTTLQVATDTP